MKFPEDVFQEFVAEVGLQRLARELHECSHGRWYQETDMVMELRRRLVAAGVGHHVADSLAERMIQMECVRRIAYENQQ